MDMHEKVERDFTYHAPKNDQVERYQKLRDAARAFAHLIVDLTPDSAERDAALSLLNLATMQANASIARNE